MALLQDLIQQIDDLAIKRKDHAGDRQIDKTEEIRTGF